jgi:biopolymer transport protein TolR
MAVSTAEESDVLSEINITPLVDVMLVLLVAFVITIPALTNAIHVNLPRTVNTTPPEQQRAITVTVDTAGTIYFDDAVVAAAISMRGSRRSRRRRPIPRCTCARTRACRTAPSRK